MVKLKKKSHVRLLVATCVMVYFASYLTRINYAAILVEFMAKEGVSKSAASLAVTIAFITYGTGQLLSGFLGDRFSPRMLILGGLIVTVSMNIIMPLFSPNIAIMTIVWGINGLAQAFMWPPLIKILTAALTEEDYTRSVAFIGAGSGGAAIVIYLIAPVIISVSGWKAVFYFCSGAAVLVSIPFFIISGHLLRGVDYNELATKKNTEQAANEKSLLTKVVTRLIPVILTGIVLQGILRDGLQTWMPTFMSETFHVKSTVSIFMGVCLPLFHIICNLLVYPVLQKMHGNIFATITLIFTLITLMSVGVIFSGGSIIVTLILLSLIEGFSCGINVTQTCYIPKYFIGESNLSFISGLLNFGTYIGAAVSTYLFAMLSEKFGWTITLISWVVFGFLGAVLSLFCERKCKRAQKGLSA